MVNVYTLLILCLFQGEKKKDKQIVPDKWKKGARNTTRGRCGGRKIGANMLL